MLLTWHVCLLCSQALKLYWHVLESMLRSEERSSGVAGIASLVTRWSFHQCLLACSFEILVACYRMGSLSFPKVAERLRLQPFDMTKMIAPFVHCEPSLPRELKHHLFTIEEKVSWGVARGLLKADGYCGSFGTAAQQDCPCYRQ